MVGFEDFKGTKLGISNLCEELGITLTTLGKTTKVYTFTCSRISFRRLDGSQRSGEAKCEEVTVEVRARQISRYKRPPHGCIHVHLPGQITITSKSSSLNILNLFCSSSRSFLNLACLSLFPTRKPDVEVKC